MNVLTPNELVDDVRMSETPTIEPVDPSLARVPEHLRQHVHDADQAAQEARQRADEAREVAMVKAGLLASLEQKRTGLVGKLERLKSRDFAAEISERETVVLRYVGEHPASLTPSESHSLNSAIVSLACMPFVKKLVTRKLASFEMELSQVERDIAEARK